MPISEDLHEVLDTMPKLSNYVFVDTRKQPMNKNKVTRDLKPLIHLFKLPDFTIKSLRHYYAKRKVGEGLSVEMLSKELGHELVSSTRKVYGELFDNS